MRVTPLVTGIVMIICAVGFPSVLAVAAGLVIWLGGDLGIILGTIGATVGGALCITLSIFLVMIGLVLIVIGAVSKPAPPEY